MTVTDLAGKVYVVELFRILGFTLTNVYFWKNHKSLTKVGSSTFVSKNELPYRDGPADKKKMYDDAFDKCFKWDRYLPAQYFAELLGVSKTYFNVAIKREYSNRWFEHTKVQKLIAVKIPDEIYKLYKRNKIVHVAYEKDIDDYDGVVKKKSIMFGYY